MARFHRNSNINSESVDADEAYNRVFARKADLDQDLKVNQIHDQPGTGNRPVRRVKNRPRNY